MWVGTQHIVGPDADSRERQRRGAGWDNVTAPRGRSDRTAGGHAGRGVVGRDGWMWSTAGERTLRHLEMTGGLEGGGLVRAKTSSLNVPS